MSMETDASLYKNPPGSTWMLSPSASVRSKTLPKPCTTMTPGSPVASNRSRYSPVPDNSAVLRPGTLENEYDIVPEATNSAWPRSSTAAVPSIGQHHELAGSVPRERDVPGPVGDAQDERHVPEKPLRPTRGVHHRHGDGLVLPEHGVMLEEHRVGGVERQLGDRDHVAVDLDRARPEVDLRSGP